VHVFQTIGATHIPLFIKLVMNKRKLFIFDKANNLPTVAEYRDHGVQSVKHVYWVRCNCGKLVATSFASKVANTHTRISIPPQGLWRLELSRKHTHLTFMVLSLIIF